MIPQEKSDAVSRGLREALGTTTFEDICSVPMGLNSDLGFRIVVDGSSYLLRIVQRVDERTDPARVLECMRAAADAGLAPRLWYGSAADGISITDFVAAVPLEPTQALLQLPETLRRLHALPLFPKAFNYATAHNGFIWRLRQSGLLPKDELEEVFARYRQLCHAYPRLDSDMVSCHMDLKAENILFDGRRLWLTGWQAAMVNDRYFDLAVAANFLVAGDADEQGFLERYFDQRADEYQRARFFLMRQVVHMLAAAVFLILGSAGQPVNPDDGPPSFVEFHRRLWAGEVTLADNKLKIAYGLTHWQRLLQNARQARWDVALGIVAERNKGKGEVPRLLPTEPRAGV
jgi:hypothetical protein